MRSVHVLLLATSLLGLPCLGMAAENYLPQKLYFSLGAGYADQKVGKITIPAYLQSSFPGAMTETNVDQSIMNYKIAVGYGFSEGPRLELAYLGGRTVEQNLDQFFKGSTAINILDYNAKFSTRAVLVNGFFDFPLGSTIILPYVGAGIGMASNSVKWSGTAVTSVTAPISGKNSKNGFAWQLGVGARIRITSHFFADLGISHIEYGRFDWEISLPGTVLVNPMPLKVGAISANQLMLSVALFLGKQNFSNEPSLLED